MSNPLKKTMVYLGLADEELEYEAELGDHGWLAPRDWRDVCERTQLAAASRLAEMVPASRRPLN